MAGPTNRQEALSWIREAVREEHYDVRQHVYVRLVDRSLSVPDLLHVLQHAASIEPYSEPPRQSGTCWRVFGKGLGGQHLAVGVEAYRDAGDRWAILCTIF